MLRSLAILVSAALPAVVAGQQVGGSGMADVNPAIHKRLGTLSNGRVTAQFNSRGLAALTDSMSRVTYRLTKDEFAVTLGGQNYDSISLGPPSRKNEEDRVTYSYSAGPYKLDVVYELRPTGRFVTKRLAVTAAPPGRFRLDEFTLFRFGADPVREFSVIRRGRENLGTADYGAFLRFDRSRGLLVTAQNPFLAFQREGNDFSIGYKPGMDWDIAWGPFQSDPGLLAPYELSGRALPDKMLPEWRLGPIDETPGLDEAEVEAFTDAVRASLLYKPANPLNILVGWCANDYQIDIATPEGRAEYKRILDMASTLGAEHVLFAPTNSEVSRREDSRDDWKWEYTLWLGLGQKIRKGEWDPSSGPIPASVQEMLDYARFKKLGLVAYVYPVMGFTQKPEWLLGAGGTRANLGVRSFQDWLIAALEGFLKHTGISGYAFDHTFLAYEGASKYAQWWGWRRVMETLRRDIPDIVIDGRQAYQLYGPWTWLAGSYPHPTSTDEQPESFVSFPDLKLNRVSADRERYTAYRYRNYEFAPSEIVPGFITHQTGRNDESGHMPEAHTPVGDMLLPFRQRDWDYLGWRYSLLSSIAIAGWNNVLDMIPARDAEEFKNFSEADRKWFQEWIDWTDINKDHLRHTRTILGQPAIGKVDGTSAIVHDGGFVFLFNPNGRRLDATFTLDETIGLKRHGTYTVKELYPLAGRHIGKAGAGFWSWRDSITRPMDGGSALVLEIEYAESSHGPTLFNSPGSATLDGRVLRLEGVQGEKGTSETLLIALPSSAKVDSIQVGQAGVSPGVPPQGPPVHFVKPGLIEIPVTFAGAPFRHYQQIDTYDPAFTGGPVNATFRIPKRVFDQLEARGKAWPIPWTPEDLRSTWLAPERLLLYVQLAEPDDQWTASLKIDGRPIELLKAYASVRVSRRNFVGLYADVSQLAADVDHKLELDLPHSLKPGQFQGVFFENIETEYTSEIR